MSDVFTHQKNTPWHWLSTGIKGNEGKVFYASIVLCQLKMGGLHCNLVMRNDLSLVFFTCCFKLILYLPLCKFFLSQNPLLLTSACFSACGFKPLIAFSLKLSFYFSSFGALLTLCNLSTLHFLFMSCFFYLLLFSSSWLSLRLIWQYLERAEEKRREETG